VTKPWTCAQVDEASAELALGLLSGNDRGAALEHVEHCARCRELVTANATVIDRLLVAAPCAEPPAGFEARVLEAVDAARPEATLAPPGAVRRRRALVALAAAAVLLVVGLTVGIGLFGNSGGGTRTRVADMIGANGTKVGKVEIGRSPSTMLVALPGWYEPKGVETTYRLTIVTRSGKAVTVDPLRLDESGTWSGALSVDPSMVASVSVTDAAGRPLCHATLTRS
jgi:hypothetical protein